MNRKELFFFMKWLFKQSFKDLYRIIRRPASWTWIIFFSALIYWWFFGSRFLVVFVSLLGLIEIWKEYVRGDWKHEMREINDNKNS